MRSIWHKAVAVNEWRARIAPASISKQCIFCISNTSESVKHKFEIVFKLGGLGGGPPTLCTNFAGSGPAITTLSIGLKLCSEK